MRYDSEEGVRGSPPPKFFHLELSGTGLGQGATLVTQQTVLEWSSSQFDLSKGK